MAVLTRSALKALFEDGDQPTGQNFSDWLDSYIHQADEILISRITGLQTALDNATVADGDKGDIVVSSSGATWLLDTISGLVAGTYQNPSVQVDAKGRVIAISSGAKSRTTLQASGETDLSLVYTGTVPVYTKTANGEYQLAIPTGTEVESITLKSNGSSTLTGSGALKLRLVSAAGFELRGVYQVRQNANGDSLGELQGVVIRETYPSAGTTLVEFPNMSAAAGGYTIIGKI